MMDDNARAGKFLLEILTNGMYSNPLHIYREYIQNATDSIDTAISLGLLTKDSAEIHMIIDRDHEKITIRDNGIGISSSVAQTVLLSLGDSTKDPTESRGFRGIGRISGLGYADRVTFVTSANGENKKTIMVCNGQKMRSLLSPSTNEVGDVMDAFRAISLFSTPSEASSAHYFEVIIERVIPAAKDLLDEDKVTKYLASTAPVDFDQQKFTQGGSINRYFADNGFPITCYSIYKGKRKLPIYKLYSRSLNAGKHSKTKTKDYVKSIEFVYEEANDGSPLYIGWLAITDFSGQLSDPEVQGIRLRKGNILIGDNKTFERFFPSEGENANKMFAGEIHALHSGLIPNSQRDFFEPNEVYLQFYNKLQNWARNLNKKYRRGTSLTTSAIRKVRECEERQAELSQQIQAGAISSDTKREQIAQELEHIQKTREKEVKVILRAIESGTIDEERSVIAKELIAKSRTAQKAAVDISSRIVSAEYATKGDLPTSYSRDERKLYQRIIEVVDAFFEDKPEVARALREAIKEELIVKKK